LGSNFPADIINGNISRRKFDDYSVTALRQKIKYAKPRTDKGAHQNVCRGKHRRKSGSRWLKGKFENYRQKTSEVRTLEEKATALKHFNCANTDAPLWHVTCLTVSDKLAEFRKLGKFSSRC
jgi:hypothetical protein